MLTIGVDTHKATLAASLIDDAGRELGARTFGNDHRAHLSLLRWAQARGSERRFGVEGSGSYCAGLARLLAAAGEIVVEVPAVLTKRERRHLGRAGKSGPGDALAIARVTLREQGLGPVQVAGIAEDLKLLVDARDRRIGERTRGANRLHAYLVVLAPGYDTKSHNLTMANHVAAAGRLIRRDRGTRAELASAEWARPRRLTGEILGLERQIGALVRASGSSLPAIRGAAAITAAQATGRDRRSTAVAPIPASSGFTSRHRLNRGGNPQLNRTLHTIAIVQARIDPRAQTHLAKRMAEGKSRLESLRCLKRHLADIVFRTMMADALGRQQNPRA